MMNNPVAISAVRTSNRLAYDQVSEQEALEFAIARFNPSHPRLEECNFACEVVGDDNAGNGSGSAAVEQIERFFAERGVVCSRWLPAANEWGERMDRALTERGYSREDEIAMLHYSGTAMLHRPDAAMPQRSGAAMLHRSGAAGTTGGEIRVVSGRAMRRGLTTVLTERAAGRAETAAEWVEVALGRLDDPQYDSYLALRGDRPVGMAALHQAGEIGRVRDVYVPREERRSGVASALVHYLVATAHRWRLRPICAEVDERNAAGRALLARAGFEEAGRLTAFRAPAAKGWIW